MTVRVENTIVGRAAVTQHVSRVKPDRALPNLSPSPPTLFFMVEDKYVGLALAVSGTVAIGSSFIITKKVHAAFLQSDDLFTFRHPGP